MKCKYLIPVLLLSFLLIIVRVTAHAQSGKGPKVKPLNLEYLLFSAKDIEQNDTILPVYHNNAFYYQNIYTGEILYNKAFIEAYPFHNGYGLVKEKDRYGIIDRSGKYVIPPKYFSFRLERIYLQLVGVDGTWYFRFDGKLHEQGYLEGEPVMPHFSAKKKGKRIYIYYSGYPDGPAKKIYGPVDSVLLSRTFRLVVKHKKKVGMIDTAGRYLIPMEYEGIATQLGVQWPYYGAWTFALRKQGYWCYFKWHGSEPLFKSTIKAISFYPGVFIYQHNNLFNYLDKKGERGLPNDQKWISAEGFLTVNERNELTLIDRAKHEHVYLPLSGQ